MSETRRLVAIVGPTASGKSALGVWLAERLDGEILACDSSQVYRGFDLGTAKPTPAERSAVRHHLLDLVSPAEVFHAGEYRRRALGVLDDLVRRGKLPILTVGTGLYLRALLEGLCPAPGRSDELRERLRRRVETRGPAYLAKLLERLDPEAARRIGPRDAPKMIRAIEVRLVSGRPLTALHREGREPLAGYRTIKIGLMPARTALYDRIHRRVDAMVAAGWIDEVRERMAAGVPSDAKPFQFIGYGEWREFLEGNIGQEEALDRIRQATRRYAKRQITWFRRETGVCWLEGFGDDLVIRRAALTAVEMTSVESAATVRDPERPNTL